MLHRISAGAIVAEGDRILFVRHYLEGRYDFLVCPGGGVKNNESLEDAAKREVKEETGLEVAISRLVYIEEFFDPECRHVKFWFLAEVTGGELDTSQPEATQEHIVSATWLTPDSLQDETTFPPLFPARWKADKDAGFPSVVRLPLRAMDFW